MSIVFLGASAASVVACGAADIGEPGGDELAVLEEELGEAGCGTMACTSANSCAALDAPNACGGPSQRTSTLPYGSATCPSQYVVADSTPPTNGGTIRSFLAWRGAPLTAANCSSAVVEVALYAKVGTAASATLQGVSRFRGLWNGTNCVLNGTDPMPSVAANTSLKEVRLAGSARLGATQQRVGLGFWHYC
jgi:hypothetical protein